MQNSVNQDVSPVMSLDQRISRRYLAPEERLIGLGRVVMGTKFLWAILLWYCGGYSLIGLSAFLSGEVSTFLGDYQTPSLGLLLALALCIDHLIGNNIRAGTRRMAEHTSRVNVGSSLDWLETSVLKTVFDQRTRIASGIATGGLSVLALLFYLQLWYKTGMMVGLFSLLVFVAGFFAGSALSGGVLTSVAIRRLSSTADLRLNIHYPLEAKICIAWSLQVALGLSVLASVAYVLLTWVPWPLILANQQLVGYFVLCIVFSLSLVVFIVPIMSFHRVLGGEKEKLLVIIGNEEREAYGRTIEALQSTSHDKYNALEADARRLEILRGLRLSTQKISAWPLDVDSIGRFLLSTITMPLVVVLLTKLIERLVA